MAETVCVPTKGGVYCGEPQPADPLWLWPIVLIVGVLLGVLVAKLAARIDGEADGR